MFTLAAAPLTAAAQAQAEQPGINPLITIGAFLLMLFILVVVHELGHFLTAVWLKIKVEEFGIGYPPRAATLFEHKGVKYTLNWLPLGGFVRFATSDGAPGESLYGAGGSLAQAHPWRRILVMVAGPLMNLLLAVLIFAGLFMAYGIPQPTGGQVVTEIFPGAPAANAGLLPGDVIVRLDGQSIIDPETITEVATARAGQTVAVEILRDGQPLTLSANPGPWTTPDGDVLPAAFGFRYRADVELTAANPLTAIAAGANHTGRLLEQMFRSLGALPGAIAGLFVPGNDAEGPIGPVGIARATGEVLQQESGLQAFWNLTALLSVNLFLLNLLPIPALDGSHIIFSLVEWLRGGKRVSPEKEAMVHAIGFMALMGLMLIVTVNDVIKAISGAPVLGGS